MKHFVILTVLSFVLNHAYGAFPPKGWTVGSCQKIDQQISNELSELNNIHFSKIPTYHAKLLKMINVVSSNINLTKVDFQRNYSVLQEQLLGLNSKLTTVCLEKPYIHLGSAPDKAFTMLELECLLGESQKLSLSYLAVKSDDQLLFNDGQEHLMARFCIGSGDLFKRGNRRMTWLSATMNFCVNYDLESNLFLNYQTSQVSDVSELKELTYLFNYDFNHFDPNSRLTPAGINSSKRLSVEDFSQTEGFVRELLTPKSCGNSGRTVYPDDLYLTLIPNQKCPWYDLQCIFDL